MDRADSFSYTSEQPNSSAGQPSSTAEQSSSGESGAPARPSIDRLELMNQQWVQQAEEEQADAAAALYAKAARQWMHSEAGEVQDSPNEEELEAMSQELKLRQKCLDIAAQVLVDGLDDELDDEDEV